MVQRGSSAIFVLSLSARFSHSSAILTMPFAISFCSALVCMESSTTMEGRHLGFSCTERLTRPLRRPNRVPETLAPLLTLLRLFWWWWCWWPSVAGMAGNLQEGVMMGRERKTERNMRTILGFWRFLREGWTREMGSGGGGGGGGDADLGSPIGSCRKRRSVP
uniref:Uncharacterized protein n=1 Tax=Cajanus cajan TaxID=3821 RepID=A0A151TQN2_CAJCA|nr:hypothetical protein KK1_008543 [Cajanus cajan]